MLKHPALTPLEAESTASETRKTAYDLESWRAAAAARHWLKAFKAMLVYIRASAQRARRRIARAEQNKTGPAHAPVPVGATNPGPRPMTLTPPPPGNFSSEFRIPRSLGVEPLRFP